MHVSRKSQFLLFEASDRSALLPVISWWCKGKNGQLILLETNSKICFSRRTNECVTAHPAQAASTQLPPRRRLLLAAHITCGVIYCFILWLRVLAKWGSRCQCAQQVSTFNCLGVLAQTSVCPTSCAAPQETQYGVYLVCCKSHSWPVSSLMHGVPRSLCSRAPAGTGTQGTTHIFPLLGFPNFPAVHCSCLWWPLVLCQPLPLAQRYPHPRAPALHISCAVRPILSPLHSYQIPEWSRVPREWSEVVFCLQRACSAHLHLPLLQLTCCRSWGAAGLSGKHA